VGKRAKIKATDRGKLPGFARCALKDGLQANVGEQD
jgi:hypothetical protein